MITRVSSAFVFVLVLLGTTAAHAAAEPVVLRYKGDENVSYLVERTLEEEERAGEGETQTSRVRALVRYGPREPKPHGPILLTFEVHLLSIDGNMEKETKRYVHPKHPEPAFRPVKWVRPLGPVKERRQAQVIAKQFDGLPFFPEDGVEPGDSWELTRTVVLHHSKEVAPCTFQHRFEGYEEANGTTCAKISYSFSGEFRSADHPEALIDTYKKDMKPNYTFKGRGTAMFDPARGIFVKKEQHVERTHRTTGKPSRELLRQWPGIGASDKLSSSQITVELISEEKADELMPQAEAFRASLREPAPAPEPPAKWTYHVEQKIVQRELARTKTWVDCALVGYGAPKPKVVYVDEEGKPIDDGPGGPGIQPLEQETLFLTAKLPEFGGPGSGQPWPVGLITRCFDAFPILPDGDLTPDRRWTSEIEMVLGMTSATRFTAAIEHTSKDYEERLGRRCLKIEYTLAGKFSTADHPERFPADRLKEYRGAGSVSGSGVAYVDLEEGILVEKEQTTRWTSLNEKLRRLEGGKIGWVPAAEVEEQTEIKVALQEP